MTPTSAQVKQVREAVQASKAIGITAAQKWCAEALHTSLRAFQQWETGARRMHPAFWELLMMKMSVMTKANVIEASAARDNFAQLGAQAKLTPVQVTRHGKLEFVVISPDMYEAVKATGGASGNELQRMQASLEKMFQGMQLERSATAYDALLSLSAEDIPGAVAKANRKLEQAATKRPKLRAVR